MRKKKAGITPPTEAKRELISISYADLEKEIRIQMNADIQVDNLYAQAKVVHNVSRQLSCEILDVQQEIASVKAKLNQLQTAEAKLQDLINSYYMLEKLISNNIRTLNTVKRDINAEKRDDKDYSTFPSPAVINDLLYGDWKITPATVGMKAE